MKVVIIFLMMVLTFCSFKVSAQSDTPETDEYFEEQHLEHLVLTQYYRWFQAFERDLTEARIQNHLAILSDSVLVTTYNGPLRGKEGMLGFLNYVSGWKNAHHIEHVEVRPVHDAWISLEADIVYQNILPDGKQNAYKLHYTTRLKKIPNELPVFTEVKLLPTETYDEPDFEDAYIKNRSKSFMYYWFYLMDNLKDNEARFKELLAPDFRLELLTEEIVNFEEFEDWMKVMQGNFKTTLHRCKSFSAVPNLDQTITVALDVEWKGVNANGEKVVGVIRNEWTLENDPDERFARVKRLRASEVEPFQVVQRF